MESSKIAVVIYWKTKNYDTVKKMAARFDFEPYISLNRRTGAMIKKEDMELLEECEKRGIIEIKR